MLVIVRETFISRILKFWKFWRGAHDAEILLLSFSLSSKKEANSEEAANSKSFLASRVAIE